MFIDENTAMIRRYIDLVWNEGNLDCIAEVWGEHADERRAGWESNRRFCPDGRFMIDDLIMQGDKVVVRWTLEGTQPSEGTHTRHGSVSARRAINFSGITIWRVQFGRLADSYFVSDGPGLYE